MIPAERTALFTRLFDDASLYPPAATELPHAVRAHEVHRLSWYADLVGPFVCNAVRLHDLDAQVRAAGLPPFEVSMVVPDGIDALPTAMGIAHSCEALTLRGIEVPIGTHRPLRALRALESLDAPRDVTRYLEVPVLAVTEQIVHDLSGAGIRLKLRTGGTSIDAFSRETELAAPIVLCAAERLAFKCTAGLHNAVRHRDPRTTFEHHGFLNVMVAARVAASTENPSATAAALSERDPGAVADAVAAFTPRDVAAVRALFTSFGTCSIEEPVADLIKLGLVSQP